jgi:hypothetical protein
MNRALRVLIAAVFLAAAPCAPAQQRPVPDSSLSGHPLIPPRTGDSVSGVFLRGDSAARVDTFRVIRTTKSPGTAVLLSALLPGAGQAYNRSYWKVPIVLGFGVYFAEEWISNNRQYRNYRDQYNTGLAVNGGQSTLYLNGLRNVRDFYRDQRDAFTWYFLILYFVNILDAYVDASLYDFDVGGNLGLRTGWDPPTRASPGISLSVRFHF